MLLRHAENARNKSLTLVLSQSISGQNVEIFGRVTSAENRRGGAERSSRTYPDELYCWSALFAGYRRETDLE